MHHGAPTAGRKSGAPNGASGWGKGRARRARGWHTNCSEAGSRLRAPRPSCGRARAWRRPVPAVRPGAPTKPARSPSVSGADLRKSRRREVPAPAAGAAVRGRRAGGSDFAFGSKMAGLGETKETWARPRERRVWFASSPRVLFGGSPGAWASLHAALSGEHPAPCQEPASLRPDRPPASRPAGVGAAAGWDAGEPGGAGRGGRAGGPARAGGGGGGRGWAGGRRHVTAIVAVLVYKVPPAGRAPHLACALPEPALLHAPGISETRGAPTERTWAERW